jgi:ATP-dependent Clp protease adaptor protein ClpS
MPARTELIPRILPSPSQETELEPIVRVIIHNDDVTPMDFVTHILRTIFFINGPAAVHIMFTAHYSGAAYVQSLPKSEAVNRTGRAHFAAGIEGYPLHFTLEPEE